MIFSTSMDNSLFKMQGRTLRLDSNMIQQATTSLQVMHKHPGKLRPA